MKNLLISSYIHNRDKPKQLSLLPGIYYSSVLEEVSVRGHRACILIRSLNEKL